MYPFRKIAVLLAAVLAMGTVPFSGSAASAETFTNNALYMDRPYVEIDTSRRMYVVDGWYSDFKVKQNLVDYDSGLQEATAEWYHSDQVAFWSETEVQTEWYRSTICDLSLVIRTVSRCSFR